MDLSNRSSTRVREEPSLSRERRAREADRLLPGRMPLHVFAYFICIGPVISFLASVIVKVFFCFRASMSKDGTHEPLFAAAPPSAWGLGGRLAALGFQPAHESQPN